MGSLFGTISEVEVVEGNDSVGIMLELIDDSSTSVHRDRQFMILGDDLEDLPEHGLPSTSFIAISTLTDNRVSNSTNLSHVPRTVMTRRSSTR